MTLGKRVHLFEVKRIEVFLREPWTGRTVAQITAQALPNAATCGFVRSRPGPCYASWACCAPSLRPPVANGRVPAGGVASERHHDAGLAGLVRRPRPAG